MDRMQQLIMDFTASPTCLNNIRRPLTIALKSTQVISPITVLLFFLIASAVIFVEPAAKTAQSTPQPYRRSLELILSGVIGLLYIAQSGTIITQTRSGDSFSWTITDLDLVFTLYSTLAWLVLFLGSYSSGNEAKRYNFCGAWIISFCFEVLILGLSSTCGQSTHTAQFLQAGFPVLRLGFIASLVGIGVWIPREHASDEETTPLLQDSTVHNDPSRNLVAQTTNSATNQRESHSEESTAVSSEQSSQSAGNTASTAAWFAVDNNDDDDDDDDEDEEGAEAAKKVGQNWWHYFKTFKIFLPYIWPRRNRGLQANLLGVALCLLVERVFNVLGPFTFKWIIDKLTKRSDLWGLCGPIATFILIGLLNSSSGVSQLERILWFSVQRDMWFRLKTAAYEKVMALSCDYHSIKKSGRMWQVVQRGQSVLSLFRTVLIQLLPMSADLLIAIGVFFFSFDAYVGFIVAITAVLYWWSTVMAAGKTIVLQRANIKDWEKEYYQMTESTLNWNTVSHFNRHLYEIDRYKKNVTTTQTSRWQQYLFTSLVEIMKNVILKVGLSAACILVACQIVSDQKKEVPGGRNASDFVFLITYWNQLNGPLQYFATGFQEIAEYLIDAEKLLELLLKTPLIQDEIGAPTFRLDKGGVKFENVSFSYDGKREVSKNISFEVRPGETVALVGETGSGKSTLIKLLFRFYDPTTGRILVDDQDIRKVTLASFREHIGVVPQDPILFNMSVYENLRYGNLDATDDQIHTVCQAVSLHDRVTSFTKGYDEVVGERGMKLSGGELQRVAIARAMLKNPRILLLDEATSSVDTKTEVQIQKSLAELSKNRTTFVIAHRLSTIINADKILVIMNGEVVESGRHSELIDKKGPYQELWASQRFALMGGQDGKKSRSKSRSPSKGRPVLLNDIVDPAEGQSLIQQVASDNQAIHKKEKRRAKSKTRDTASLREGGQSSHATSHDAEVDRGRSLTKGILHGIRRGRSDSVSPLRAGLSSSAPSSPVAVHTVLKPDAPEFVPKSLQKSIISAPVSPRRSTDELVKRIPIVLAETKKAKFTEEMDAQPATKVYDGFNIAPDRSSSVSALRTIPEETKKAELRGLSQSPKRKSLTSNLAKSSNTDQALAPMTENPEVEKFSIPQGQGVQEDVGRTDEPKERFRMKGMMLRKKATSEPPKQLDGSEYFEDNRADGTGSSRNVNTLYEILGETGGGAVVDSPNMTPRNSATAVLLVRQSGGVEGRPQSSNGHITTLSVGSEDTDIAIGPKMYAPANTPASPASPAGGDEGERGLFDSFEKNDRRATSSDRNQQAD